MVGLFNKISLSAVVASLVLLALIQPVKAAGTWDSVPMPPGITYAYKIRDCESDSKGNIYYTSTLNGLFSQSPDGSTWKEYPGVPVTDSSGYMGLYIDQSTDSVYVGTVRGSIQVGKNGVFHSLPSVPLKVMESEYTSTRIHDIYRDKNGYLTALTDSLAWWFDGTTWHIIGQKSDYDYRVIQSLQVGSYLPNGDYVANVTIIHGDRTVSPIPVYGMGLSTGPTGTIYAGGGGGNQVLYYSLPPYTKVDTLETTQQGESTGSKSLFATFEDKDGWLWIPQEGRMLFLKDMVIRKILPLPAISSPNRMPLKMILTPDSTFWMCAEKNLFRYSEKYAVPQEVLDALSVRPASMSKQISIDVHFENNAIVFEARDKEIWRVQILDLRGTRIWTGVVHGRSSPISLKPGLWLLSGSNTKGEVLRKTITIIH